MGGSTRIPFVQKSVEKVFHKKPKSLHNPDEVVALGASVYCGYKTDGRNLNVVQQSSLSKVKIQEITNHFFGTIAVDREVETGEIALKNCIIIRKGAKIPCSKADIYSTIRDNQINISCKVTQSSSEEKDPKFVKVIWEGDLVLPPDRPAGQGIKVTYSYDENQIMKCSFSISKITKKTLLVT